jgi:hypothetical protein
MIKIVHIQIIVLFAAFYTKAQPDAAWQTVSKQEAVAIIEHARNWFQTTPSYSFTVSHASYAGYTSSTPHEKQGGYFRKYATGFHSYALGINTIQNKNYLITIDTTKHIILVNNPLKKFEPINPEDLKDIQKRLDKCTAIKMLTTTQSKTLRLEFSKNSPVFTYEFCLNKDNLPKSITICYAREVKSTTNGAMVKSKLVIEFDNYHTGISPSKDELSSSKYFYEKNKNVLALNDTYEKYSLLDQRVPTNTTK